MVTVREAEPADAPAILDAHVASIRAFGPTAYDDRQVEAWATKDGPEAYPIGEDGQHVVVAEVEVEANDETHARDEIAGFGALDVVQNEVWAVYVHPNYARSGVGSALLAHLEAAARDAGADELTLVSSLNAVPFYERHGWERLGVVAVENTGGVELDCVEMRTSLSAT